MERRVESAERGGTYSNAFRRRVNVFTYGQHNWNEVSDCRLTFQITTVKLK